MRQILSRLDFRLVTSTIFGIAAVALIHVTSASAQMDPEAVTTTVNSETSGSYPFIRPTRTESPRQTLTSFLALRDHLEAEIAAYLENRTAARMDRIIQTDDELVSLLDLSYVPSGARREIGVQTIFYLLDIFGRIELPNLDKVPGVEDLEASGFAPYAIPGTTLRIVRMEEGERQGEFLFSGNSVTAAPRIYRGIERLPLRSSLDFSSWTQFMPRLVGPMIPPSVTATVPEKLQKPVLGTPAWKVGASVLILLAVAAFLVAWHRLLRRLAIGDGKSHHWTRVISIVSVIVAIQVLRPFFDFQLGLWGEFAVMLYMAQTIAIYLAAACLFWLCTIAIFETFVGLPGLPRESLDANLLRLTARLIGIIGGVIVLCFGAQAVGLPVFSVLAGLGIGGLALALAIRPTLENLIGGFVLYLDKPIRVGDFCNFGDQQGFVENIGVRSTQIRGLDRTLITIPNAQFADMQIINWAQCDQMLIQETISLRYETDLDQLRCVLVRIREMFHGHPRIDSDTVRVRFSGFGSSSLDIQIRVYAKSREWNDFFAIREDVFLRIAEIVQKTGTGFAFPSQTLYLARDGGIDSEGTEQAKAIIAGLRRNREFPFPRFSASHLSRIDDRLAYPPPGSPEFNATQEELSDGGEQLSAPDLPTTPEDTNSGEDSEPKPPATSS